jgi:hypothetical protein
VLSGYVVIVGRILLTDWMKILYIEHIGSIKVFPPKEANKLLRICLTHGWRHRNNDDRQLANLKSQTFASVEQALGHGEGRWYGRGLLCTGDYLPLSASASR